MQQAVPKSDPAEFCRRLGLVFRDRREALGLSRNRLSEDAGVSRTSLLMFERGERVPTIHSCKALADGLGVDLALLVKKAEEKEARR